ncbi:glycosyltransferase family 4 protein [Micromonospora schwarzwaldensis]|uniref:glycosyltransferase family 4 protein n=1 Tax=Micromonospora sp. DSM 45708 TaxID=3111767 RepID=UPI0031E01877
MRVIVTMEARLLRTPDGRVWTRGGPDHTTWSRYLSVFDEVRIVARVQPTDGKPVGASAVDGPGVHVWAVPYYVGPGQYVSRRTEVRRAVGAAIGPHDACILRVPSQIGTLMAQELRRRRQPYALEVIGDPWEVFAPGVVRHPLRPFFRRRFARQLAGQCRHAAAVSYVTARSLQARYPAGPTTVSMSCSDVDLPAEAFVAGPRPAAADLTRTCRLVSVGSLDQLYKGVDVLVDALAVLADRSVDVHLRHVGDGRFRSRLEERAARCGARQRVTFVGTLPPGDAVRAEFDRADLLVMPSRTEGMPRALVEGMARGLPAIGSAVGGIPEVLPAADLVPPGDPTTLADAIQRMVTAPDRMAAASARNLETARTFAAERLAARRDRFYTLVRDARRRPDEARMERL